VSSADPSADGVVRPAVLADAPAIAAVHVATWRDAYAGLLPDDFLAGLVVEEWAERWRGRLCAPADGIFTLVLESGGQVRGFVSGGPDRHGAAGGEVFAIYVDPRCQGLGAGRRLLAGAVRSLAEAGFAEARLWVLAGNEPARAFYEAQGWRPEGVEKPWTYDRDAGRSVPEVRYVRSLGLAGAGDHRAGAGDRAGGA
jgi:ribosomal protein S18 acetylase RimI-like enzyme